MVVVKLEAASVKRPSAASWYKDAARHSSNSGVRKKVISFFQ